MVTTNKRLPNPAPIYFLKLCWKVGCKAKFMALFLVAGVSLTGAAMAASELGWQGRALKSIARVASADCGLICRPEAIKKEGRVGTGFVAKLEPWDEPVLVTAYHVVAGHNRIAIEFSETGSGPYLGKLVAADPARDLAVLLPEDMANATAWEPLEFGASLPEDRQIVVFGHKSQALQLISDEGFVKLKSGSTLREMGLDSELRYALSKLDFPDLDTPIVGLEHSLSPGDSGAPIFDLYGRVIGLAHGGIPSLVGELSWMIPFDTILNEADFTDARSVPRGDVHLINGVFYSNEGLTETPLLLRPSVYFALEWGRQTEPIKAFMNRLDSLDRAWLFPKDPDETVSDSRPHAKHYNRFNNVRLYLGEEYFPGVAVDEERLLAGLDQLALRVDCYRAEKFEQLISTNERLELWWPDYSIKLMFGSVVGGIEDRELEFSIGTSGASSLASLALESLEPIEVGFSNGSVDWGHEITSLEVLYGGACRVYLSGEDGGFADFSMSMNEGLAFGAACIHLILDEKGHTPLYGIGNLNLPFNPQYSGLWGQLPIGPENASIESRLCR